MRRIGLVAAAAYIATIFLANWAIHRYGIVSVGFGLVAPAGVFFAGLAFSLRDVTQNTLGQRAVLGAIAVGAAASALVDRNLAFASATAFLVSELADFAVYTPLQRRGWLRAVVASNVVGFVLDSVLFLWLAFHSLDFLRGQLVGKAWMTAAFVALLVPFRRSALAPDGPQLS
jgi:queuosine precursor transporter